ncbi:hypothetical protein NPIL_251611 [Nephila pilipes]|uniref:Uncharacterized protein n=1 Tax=Nephila pilipes TaxID=299642 RepID=A0A8X6TIU2_NEPPI|nr:hypothetical protein NPIL_251611 [Nephila pilipes]
MPLSIWGRHPPLVYSAVARRSEFIRQEGFRSSLTENWTIGKDLECRSLKSAARPPSRIRIGIMDRLPKASELMGGRSTADLRLPENYNEILGRSTEYLKHQVIGRLYKIILQLWWALERVSLHALKEQKWIAASFQFLKGRRFKVV